MRRVVVIATHRVTTLLLKAVRKSAAPLDRELTKQLFDEALQAGISDDELDRMVVRVTYELEDPFWRAP